MQAYDPSALRGQTVAVGMSGGIDSTAVAVLLVDAGVRVLGVTARMTAEDSRCCSDEDTLRAAAVCAQLGVPHHVVDVADAFADHVIAYFGDAYVAGRTPNPCVVCNREIKFGVLLDHVRRLGATALATGHYARRVTLPGGCPTLLRGVDRRKDQSYFLARLTPTQLRDTVFPLGDWHKPEIRRVVTARGLVTRAGRESQDICFVTEGTHGEWLDLRRLVTPAPGEITDSAGRVVGRHVGVHHYTVGQRKGLGLALGHPAYVVAVDAAANRIVVGPRAAALRSRMWVEDVTWQADARPSTTFRCAVQIRYNHLAAAAAVTPTGEAGMDVVFDDPQFAVTPGQLAAFYDGDRVLGAGWIAAEAPSVAAPPVAHAGRGMP